MKEENLIDIEIADTIMERAYPFKAGRKQFFLYPVTLGKMYILQRLIDDLEINYENLKLNTNLEMLRLATAEREKVCKILAYHTCKTKEQVHSIKLITERTNLFMNEATDDDLASILIILLTRDKTETFMKHLGIDKETKRLGEIMKIKKKTSKNTLSFGGKSLYGSFIAPLLEMGMSWDQIVWERSYINLRLLLADKMNSMYLTDDELQKIPTNLMSSEGDLDANDPESSQKIIAAFKNRGIKIQT